MSYRSVFRPDLFEGQAIIVTGGGSGIGRCTAHELAALGASVALVGRNREKLETVQREIGEAGSRATWHTCDIREEDRVVEIVGEILEAHGRIDGLVNNAGGQFPAPLHEISAKGWQAVVNNNLMGGFLVGRECFKQWMADHGGNIVNIIADMWHSMPFMGHSGAARAGMLNLTKTMALEWAHAGIRVNAVAPGWVATSGFDKYPDWMTERIVGLRNFVPLKRHGTESEVSAAITFLLSEGAAFISGSCIRVDGAAPQVRADWTLIDHRNSKPFNGFHLAALPKVLQGTGAEEEEDDAAAD